MRFAQCRIARGPAGWLLKMFALATILALPKPALAEANEATVGLSGGVLFPSFNNGDPTALALATWAAGFETQYGITEDLYLRGAFLVSAFEAVSLNHRLDVDGRMFTGEFRFSGAYYHPEIGLRYKVYGGYDLAPYVEASVGYLWGTYNDATLTLPGGSNSGVVIPAFGEGAPTVGFGLAFDYRLFNMLFAGAAVRYNQLFGGQVARHYISVPLVVSFYW